MNLATKLLLFAFPERMQKYRLASRYYESGQTSHTSRGRHVFATESADGSLQRAGPTLRSWGRYLDENHDLATGALDALCREIVGKGITIEPMCCGRDGALVEDVNDQIRELIDEWSESVNVERDLSLPACQWLSCRSWLRDGELWTRHVESGYPFMPGELPYRVQLLESEMVPFSLYLDAPNVVQGVEKSAWGFPVAYYVFREHPGASISPLGLIGGNSGAMLERDTIRLPADEMGHLKHTRRIQQTRGVSVFASAIRRLEDLKDYEESEQIASKIASDMVVAITRSPEMETDPDMDTTTGERQFNIQAGMVFDNLAPGEDIRTLSHERPNPELTNFRHALGTAAAKGIGVKASDLLGDYTRGNYSSQRQELVSHRPQIEALQGLYISAHLRPMYQRLIAAAARVGRLSIRRGLDLRTLTRAAFTAPQLIWIDPQKEMAAAQLELQSGVESVTGLIRRRGRDPRIVREQIEMERELMPDEQQTAPQGQPAIVTDEDEQDAA